MNKHTQLNLLLVAAMLMAVMFSPASAAYPPGPAGEPEASTKAAPPPPTSKSEPVKNVHPSQPPETSSQAAMAKLYPSLQELARSASLATGRQPQEAVVVNIVASIKAGAEESLLEQLKPYFVDGQLYAQPALGKGEQQLQILFGRLEPAALLKVAATAEVQAVYPIEAYKVEYEEQPADEARPEAQVGPEQWAELRANADTLRQGSLPWAEAEAAKTESVRAPQDWFDAALIGPHKSEGAWNRGYKGEGVAVAVCDDGVDFGHPDLQGTYKIYSGTDPADPSRPSPYNGWPMVMDPFTMRAYAYEILLGASYVSGGFAGATYFDTSATPALSPCGAGLMCFRYTALIGYNTSGIEHTYLISSTMSKSGEVHVGTHHDENLRDYVWGERVAVLVADPNTAGVYDTVYVDLDDDHDFRDEKPMTRADPNDPNTFDNPVSYRDLTGDGIADLSGGLLYFIADGVNYIPASDWLWGGLIPPPGNGDLIAMHGPWAYSNDGSHGTRCASQVVAQGVINGMMATFRDHPTGPGTSTAAVYGAAPEADLVGMNDAYVFTGRLNTIDAYALLAVGYDGIDQTGHHFSLDTDGHTDSDPIMASSHSYGYSADFNDGYDYLGQWIAELQRNWAPYQQYLFSTGNGGPGYGTVAPPSPATGIAVGASSQYGTGGWDSITDTNQIMFNDVAALSNSGPGARDGAGVDVVANGAYAPGLINLNYHSMAYYGHLDGNVSWETWGGTSRSAPVALGNLALIYQAYKDKHGTWPTHEQARALLMSSATDVNNDVYKQGAGSVNADRGTLVASGEYGVYMDAGSATWEPGDYRGTNYPAFAHIVYPGQSYTKTFDVVNDSPSTITVNLSNTGMRRIGLVDRDLTITEDMVAAESAYGAGNRDNFYKAFNYFVPITATAGMSPTWYNVAIPADTDVMVVREIFPYDEFDIDEDYNWDNRLYLTVYNWKDINGDGALWDDKDGNGAVNFINGSEPNPVNDVTEPELVWDDPRTELDRWEFGRFGYNRPYANVASMSVQDPLGRMHDGLFVGIRHLGTYTGAVHLKLRFEFYSKADTPWLSTDVTNLTVPAGGKATFQGTVNVPADMPTGDYAAAIEVLDPGAGQYAAHNIVIPVAINVAANLSGGLSLGGYTAYNYDKDSDYNNGAMRGYFDWGWREESGDWRFYYVDVDNRPVDAGTILTQDFEGIFTDTWTLTTTVAVTTTTWDTSTNWGVGNYTGGAGEAIHCSGTLTPAPLADYDAVVWTPPFTLPTTADLATLRYKANFQNAGHGDLLDVDISANGGAAWTTLLSWGNDHGADGAAPGQDVQVNLSNYMGQSGLLLRWRYYNPVTTPDDDGYAQIDDVEVVMQNYPIEPGTRVMVKDEWEDVAPHTDIDTIILGPSPSSLAYHTFGNHVDDFRDSTFYGPYVLGTVASSIDDRADRSTWRFNTTSEANQEWLTFAVQDGLHEILQHNVLFEGSEFDVVFTKTLGLLTADVNQFNIDTYKDQGALGQVRLESTLDLNGLEVDAYRTAYERTQWSNEPIPFIANNVNEWTYEFTVTNGIDIEVWTSSPDISDIDLSIYYWDGSSWAGRGNSAGADANEYIYIPAEDGQWRIGVNNWSGPDGHFNMTLIVGTRQGGFTVTGVPSGAVAANTPVTLTVNYDFSMAPETCSSGLLSVGPPEAPALNEIPISICRLMESAQIDKKVNFDMAQPGSNLRYTIDLYNLSDAGAQFALLDPIPAGLEFMGVNGAVYEAGGNRVVYNGLLPLAQPAPSDEGFEAGVMPPQDWKVEHLGTTTREWSVTSNASYVHSGSYAAWANYDSFADSDEWLISPEFMPSASDHTLDFWAISDTNWPGATARVWVIHPDDSQDLVWDMIADEVWSTFVYRQVALDLGNYAGMPIRVAWQYVGLDGDSFGLDDVQLPGQRTQVSASYTIEVFARVRDTAMDGDTITNTASLAASHTLPQETQAEAPVSSSAVTHIGDQVADMSTSSKSARAATTLPGDSIRYDIYLVNTGSAVAQVTMVDPIPVSTTLAYRGIYAPALTANPPNFDYNEDQNQVEWRSNIAPGETVHLYIRVVADGDLPSGQVITNTATLTWDGGTKDMVATTQIVALPQGEFDVTVEPEVSSVYAIAERSVAIENTWTTTNTFHLAYTGNSWAVLLSTDVITLGAGLDDTALVTVEFPATADAFASDALTLTVTPDVGDPQVFVLTSNTGCRFDFVDDKIIDIEDILVEADYYGKSDPRFDINHDSVIDIDDIMLVIDRFGSTCPAP
jgi:uncharacterized repeat protein (TIGR01451 family)